MRRRTFITLLGGAAAAWPLAARAQQTGPTRRIGVLTPLSADDPEARTRVEMFAQALQRLGWDVGQSVQIHYRWSAGDMDRLRGYAAELLALGPEVVLAHGSPTVAALRRASRTLPIVFVAVIDPLGAGFIESLSHPGGNATGFTPFEYGTGGKWLELLKQIAPEVKHVAVLRDLAIAAGTGQLGAIQGVASSFGVELRPIDVRDAEEIERGITAFARRSNGGIVVTGSTLAAIHRNLIVALVGRHRLPAVYPYRYFAEIGGLISYGPDPFLPYRQAAGYVDRILKGEKPADLPVQAPTKYELVINLKTAKALGLEVSPMLLARADEVIE
jgi:putative ABC transport system substrate-binding protein